MILKRPLQTILSGRATQSKLFRTKSRWLLKTSKEGNSTTYLGKACTDFLNFLTCEMHVIHSKNCPCLRNHVKSGFVMDLKTKASTELELPLSILTTDKTNDQVAEIQNTKEGKKDLSLNKAVCLLNYPV